MSVQGEAEATPTTSETAAELDFWIEGAGLSPPEEPAAENDASDPDRDSVMWWNVCVGGWEGVRG